MIHVSGAFVYQPSSSPRPGISYPATFLIKLIINSDDGTPVFNSNDELLERLRAFVVLGYPQVTLYNWPLTLTNQFPVFNAPLEAQDYFQLSGVYNFGEAPRAPATGLDSGGHLGGPGRHLGSDHPGGRSCRTQLAHRHPRRILAASRAIAGPPAPPCPDGPAAAPWLPLVPAAGTSSTATASGKSEWPRCLAPSD